MPPGSLLRSAVGNASASGPAWTHGDAEKPAAVFNVGLQPLFDIDEYGQSMQSGMQEVQRLPPAAKQSTSELMRPECLKSGDPPPAGHMFHDDIMSNGNIGGTLDHMRSEDIPEASPVLPANMNLPSCASQQARTEQIQTQALLFDDDVKHDGSIGGTADWMKNPLHGNTHRPLAVDEITCDRGRPDQV